MSIGKKSFSCMCKTIPETINNRKVNYLLYFYQSYFCILKDTLNITDLEKEVVSLLAYYNCLLSEKIEDEETRWLVISSVKLRREMRDYLNISQQSFANVITNLRAKKVVIENRINERYVVYPVDGKFELTFNFIIDSTVS